MLIQAGWEQRSVARTACIALIPFPSNPKLCLDSPLASRHFGLPSIDSAAHNKSGHATFASAFLHHRYVLKGLNQHMELRMAVVCSMHRLPATPEGLGHLFDPRSTPAPRMQHMYILPLSDCT